MEKKWSTRFKVNNPNGLTAENEIEFKVVAREQITVPAGSFDAFRVEGEGWSRNSTNARSVGSKPSTG